MTSQPSRVDVAPATDRNPGRPRDRGTDEAILRSTVELLAEGGLEATTIRAVSERSGAARASIYLRWPNRDALIAAALRHAIGRPPHPLTGDIATDLRAGAEQARAIFSEPLFAALMPALIRELIASPDEHRDIWADYHTLFPNRAEVGEEYRQFGAAQGFRDDVDPVIGPDLIIGACFSRFIATGQKPSPAFARGVADAVIAGLRRPPTPRSSKRRSPSG